MRKREKLYKEIIKTKNKQQTLIKCNSYKKYWSKLIELLKLTKQSYYQKYFEEKQKNCKETLEGIHEIKSSRKTKKNVSVSAITTDGTTITDQTKLEKILNNFFTSVVANLQFFLKKSNPENFIITHTTADEIGDLISSFESIKRVGHYRTCTKIMNIVKGIISSTLSQLINNSISKRILPNICKQAYVMPIFKNDFRLLYNTYGPI